MNIFVFANCQGVVFETLLPQLVDRPLNVVRFENYEAIAGKYTAKDIHTPARDADIFICQPLGGDGDDAWLSTFEGEGTLGSAVPKNALRVAFPYIYNDALWPMFEEGDQIRNAEAVTDLLAAGSTKEEIISLYHKDEIDFRYASRMQRTNQILREKELITDIKVLDVMQEHINSRPVMTTQNHPCTVLVVSMLEQFLRIAGWESDRATDQLQKWLNGDDHNIAQLPGRWSIHRTAAAHFGLAYASGSEPGADEGYLKLIEEVCDRWIVARAEGQG